LGQIAIGIMWEITICNDFRRIVSNSRRLSVLRYRHGYNSSIHQHFAMRSCDYGISYVQSHGDVVAGNRQSCGRGETLCRQRSLNLCTSKRVTHRWPTRSRSWEEIADMGAWLDAARSKCPCLRLDEAIGSRSAVTHAKEV
jgi:hypothetical protein